MVYCTIEKYRKSEVKIYEAGGSALRESGYTEAYAAALRPSQAERPYALIERISGLNDFLQEASNTAARATRSEIVIRSTVDVSALQKQADELSKQLRELDVRIQGLNWITELK